MHVNTSPSIGRKKRRRRMEGELVNTYLWVVLQVVGEHPLFLKAEGAIHHLGDVDHSLLVPPPAATTIIIVQMTTTPTPTPTPTTTTTTTTSSTVATTASSLPLPTTHPGNSFIPLLS